MFANRLGRGARSAAPLLAPGPASSLRATQSRAACRAERGGPIGCGVRKGIVRPRHAPVVAAASSSSSSASSSASGPAPFTYMDRLAGQLDLVAGIPQRLAGLFGMVQGFVQDQMQKKTGRRRSLRRL